jgi:hypothetical protein
MSSSPGVLTDLGSFLSTASTGAAAWYNGVTEGTPVITSSQQAAANQLAINQAQQISLGQTNPFLAGILANPTVLIIGVLLFIVLLVFVIKS